ncbi:hypothetical protein SDC9_175405 [bioreactor metagenome]|uniref:Uncharacterized protein n=1 Tax=bioreactor metagenome TaxID=1076179 RepID=A0A645GM05_9ZZZZ
MQVAAQGVVRGQLVGDPGRGLLRQALMAVEPDQLGELLVGEGLQLVRLLGDQRLLGVALGRHRHVLPQRHRHRTGHQSGDAGDHDRRGGPRVHRGDADHQAGGGDDPVVGPQDTRPQPVELAGHVAGVWLRGAGRVRGDGRLGDEI